jgi:hypothetical protein
MASMSGAHAETYYQRDRDGRIIGHDEVVNVVRSTSTQSIQVRREQ